MQAMEARACQKRCREFEPRESGQLKMEIPTELIPKCPDDGAEMTMNLRSDDTFWRMKAGTEPPRPIWTI
jgi:hypothetical protein